MDLAPLLPSPTRRNSSPNLSLSLTGTFFSLLFWSQESNNTFTILQKWMLFPTQLRVQPPSHGSCLHRNTESKPMCAWGVTTFPGLHVSPVFDNSISNHCASRDGHSFLVLVFATVYCRNRLCCTLKSHKVDHN